MNYSKLQKLISSFLLFIFFFGQVFGLSFFGLFSNVVNAENKEFHDLVSIIVTDEVYNKLDGEIERYAEDIQGYLDNTKVVILPIKNDTTAFQIASMNENLFYEGYKGLKSGVSFESKLIGTVLIGNIKLPIIGDNGKTTKSILPFTDFEDKQFIYNQKTKIFEKNTENIDGINPEIFHGIISPNTGDKEKDIEQIKDFLDKDHDFYDGKNLFYKNKGILNGKTGEKISEKYKPYVFYFDQIREKQSIDYISYKGYETYLKNKEDILYKRYSQSLNDSIQEDINGAKGGEINDLLKGIDNQDILNAFKNTKKLDASDAPDISLKFLIDSAKKKFLEIFNKGTISDFRTNVHNAGRYNEGSSKVNVDMIPYLISVLDDVTDKSLKSSNNDLEDYIFSKLQGEIIHLPIPVSIMSSEGLPKDISGGNSNPYKFDEGIPASYSFSNDKIPPEFFLKSNDLSPEDIEFTDLGVCIKSVSNNFPETLTYFGNNGCSGLYVTRRVFSQILDMKGFYADAYGNTEFQLSTGENVLMKVPALKKIIREFSSEYYNFYNGKSAEYLGGVNGGAGKPDFCSLYRGNTENGGQLTEQNHGFNSRNGQNDGDKIQNCEKLNVPFEKEEDQLSIGYWGGNSILNFKETNGINIVLNSRDPSLAINDLFDPLGSQKAVNGKNPGIIDCYNYNYILTKKPINTIDPGKQAEKQLYNGLPGINTFFENPYRLPIKLSENEPLSEQEPQGWSCHSENQKFNPSSQTDFGKIYVISTLEGMLFTVGSTNGKGSSEVGYNGNDGVDTAEQCLTNGIELWYGAMGGQRTLYKASNYVDHEGNEIICPVTRYRYDFTSTEGFIKHTYPDTDTLNTHIKNPGISSLPINKDRYLEIFTGDIIKYKYPYLFRVELNKYSNLFNSSDKEKIYTIEGAKKILDKFLEEYDNQTGNVLDVRNYVTTKPDVKINIGGEEKIFNYYDFLAFSILWNNMSSVSAKYKFILENYLSDQVGGNDFKFILPKNKKEYEIAYLGAEGDAQNMYVKVDPEDKINTNPYSDIFSRNSLLNSNKISVGVLNGTNKINYSGVDVNELPPVNYEDGLFKCAPPEGVPIWEWIPAVMCRLGGLLPPEVSIGAGECSESTLFKSDEDIDYYSLQNEQEQENNQYISSNGGVSDVNKNGIGDVCENKIKNNGSLKLYTDSKRYSFNSNGILNTEVVDKDGKRVMLDNSSYTTYNLNKIIDKNTGKVVFDSSKNSFKEKKDIIKNYITFNEISIKNRKGTSKYSFSLKNKEADISFKANLKLKSTYTNKIGVEPKITAELNSNSVLIKVRNNKLFLSSSLIGDDGKQGFGTTIKASDKTNIYLSNKNNTELNIKNINNNSIILGLLNIGDNSKNKNIDFPINIVLKNSKNKIIRKDVLNNLNGIKKLFNIQKSGSYKIIITDKYDFKVEKNIEVLPLTPSKLKIDLGTNILEKNDSISTNLVSIYDKYNNIINGETYKFDLNILGDSIVFNDNNSKNLKLSTYEGYKAFRVKSSGNSGISKLKIDLYKNDKKLLTTSKNINIIEGIDIDIKYSDIVKVGNNEYEAELNFKDKKGNLLSNLNSRVYLSAGDEYIKLLKPYYDIVNGKSKIKFSTKTLSGENKLLTFRVEGFKSVIDKNITILPEKAFGLSFVNVQSKLEANSKKQNVINVELRDIYNNVVFTDNTSVINLEILDKYKKFIDSGDIEKTLYKGKTSFSLKTTDLPGKAYLKISINKKLEDNEFIVGEGEKQLKIYGASENALKIETYFFYNKKSVEKRKYNALYTTLLGAEYGDITQKNYLASAMLFDKENRSLAVTSLLNSPYNTLDSLFISEEGIIKKTYNKSDLTQDISISLKKDLSNNKYYLNLFNSALNSYIGKIYLNFEDLNVVESIYTKIENGEEIDLKQLFNLQKINIFSASNKVKLNSLLENKNNSLIIYIQNSSYKLKDLYSINGNSKSIYYIDPFKTETSLNSFSSYTLDSYDNFIKNKKVGWGAGNKTLLAFSAGESVGDSTKQYMGISGINLGDPIISLKKIKKKSYGITKKFDSTIGKKLNNKEVKTYKLFDYNNNNLNDILFIEGNGILSLLENTKTSKGFLNQKHLAKLVDMGKDDLVSTGDFSGDGFDDIFFVNNKGEPFLLDNKSKDFVRIDLKENFGLKGKIIQAKAFDMDNDSIDDIVTLDDAGEINIFYGKSGTTNFTKKNVYSGYGMKLNSVVRNDNAAIYFDGLVQDIKKGTLETDSTKFRSVDILENLMFESIAYDPDIDRNKENPTKNTKFIKSEFASQVGLKVKKTFKDINGGKLNTGDIIEVEINVKNTTNKAIKDIVYLENIPKYFGLDFDSIKTDGNNDIKGGIGNYKFMIDKFRLNSGSSLKITYKVKTKALAYGFIKVGLFEKAEVGDDLYGDILVSLSEYNCGGNSDIFRSTDRRKYLKGLKKESCDQSVLPDELAKNDIDEDENGIPDYIDKLIPENPESPTDAENASMVDYANSSLEQYAEDTKVEDDLDIYESIDSINDKIDEFSSDIDNLIDGFGCGFGGGSCFVMPINWAPLAPGNDISTPFGLIGDGLKINEGMPVFSTLTGLQTSNGCFPTVWPVSPLAYIPGPTCGPISAGGYLGTWSPTNNFRFFITPTLTGGIGAAACFGGPAITAGQIPPQPVTPFIPFGNCVVAAVPLPNLCGDEEISGDPSSIGQVEYIGTNGGTGNGGGDYGVINGNCSFGSERKPLPISNKIDTSLANAYLDYRNSGVQSSELAQLVDSKFSNIEDRQIDYNSSLLQNQPLISIGGVDASTADINVSFDSQDGFKFNEVEELRMKRVAPFPRFITQWVNDQIEEFITKLVDFPTLFIILPDFSKIFDKDWGEYTKSLVSGTKKSYQTSGIKEAYQFLGNVPFVTIEGETVNINIPEIDPEYYESIISQWKLVLESYPQQISEAVRSGKYSPESIISAREFMKSLEINIGILETYKDIPGAISKLFNKKQEYLEQIMCNIETIENVTGGWLGFNGKRFKAWVELYLLIKAILKSWQLLVDIFQDYDEQCHECKNERWDSIQWEWTIISMIIPPIPVIQFPKWPDVVLDISNIRLNLAIKLPEFKVNTRPIILPPAPVLLLPDYNFRVPPLKRLPLLEIPELPDIPSLPTVKLPDLPPPPSLPKIWSSIESFLKILKLIVKMMCILKKVPLVPEHRVGSQIAFLTEGGGFRGFDFIDQLLPNFSYPYLDEIKVTSYVNLEFETDFITEMARTIVSPINDMTNDFTNIFNGKGVDDIDLTKYSKEVYTGEEVNSKEFLSLVNKELSKDYISNNPEFDELRKSFDVVNNYTYSKEDKLIKNLQKANYEKFDILKSIIKKEIKETKDLKQNVKGIVNNEKYKKIANNNINDIKVYNKSLKKYNDAFKQSAKELINPSYFDTESIKESGKNILQEVKKTTDDYNKFVTNKYKNSFGKNTNGNKVLAQNNFKNTNYLSYTNTTNVSGGSCSAQKKSKYSRKYEGIYIIQQEGNTKINYKLFDYLDDLTGKEYITPIDYDLDGDLDLLYLVDGDVYLKENLIKNKEDKIYLSGVEVLNSDDNKFLNGEIAYEAVNGLTESYVANEFINVNFQSSNRKEISNYRFEYYSIIDKYLNEGNSSYIPEKIEKNIVDSFAGIDDSTIQKIGTGFIIRNNLAHIYEVGNNIPNIVLKTKKLLNIKDSLLSGKLPIISGNTQLFSGGTNADIKYQYIGGKEVFSKTIKKLTNIEFDNAIKIIELSGNVYVKGDKDIVLNGNEIYNYIDLPIFKETKIYKTKDFITNSSSHIGIRYYDESENNLDFRKIKSYEIYDLGIKGSNYSINLKTPNDYFYSRISIFKNNIFGTKTSQTLLSPQKESDREAPELNINSRIRIPVYQKQIIDLTDSLYENSGFENIDSFIIEGIDDNKYKILKTSNKLRIEFGKFNKIFTKKVKFIIKDNNGNTLKKDVILEVYPPVPQIQSYTGSTISGNINEQLNNEPINLYRFRGGSLKRLETNSGTTKVDTQNGSFNFNLSNIQSDLLDVNINNSNIFTVNENTGKISLIDDIYKIKANINSNNFVDINVLDKGLEPIFKETIKTNGRNIDINVVNDFSDLDKNGLYLRMLNSDFDYYKIPDSVKFNPGSIIIYRKTDSNKEPLFAILPDSRIKLLNGFYKVEYSTFNDYISLKLIDRHFNKQIGQLLFKLDSSYIIQ